MLPQEAVEGDTVSKLKKGLGQLMNGNKGGNGQGYVLYCRFPVIRLWMLESRLLMLKYELFGL